MCAPSDRPDPRESIPARMERIVEGLCDALRLDYEFEYQWGYPPTVNNAQMNEVVREHVFDHVLEPTQRVAGPRGRAAEELLSILKSYI